MKSLIFVFFISLFLVSCFDEANFQLSNGQIVTVDQQSLKEFEVGQRVWLIRGHGIGASEWEILSVFTIDQIGFKPEKDTAFIFNSLGGSYKRTIALGTLIKKK